MVDCSHKVDIRLSISELPAMAETTYPPSWRPEVRDEPSPSLNPTNEGSGATTEGYTRSRNGPETIQTEIRNF
jgi:hypothetical protein